MSGRVSAEIVAGTVVGRKYRIERVIASGGQGTVFEATHLRLQQSVAVKFPHVDSQGAERHERLFREARAAFRLRSEHVARVIDVDTDAETLDGAPFIVMEYLRGADLTSLTAADGALKCDEAVGLLLQACEGIAEAHDLGIVHRDLKPSNLFLVERPSGPPLLKVLDFGLAKRVTPALPTVEDPELTEPLRMMGSPRYMSPEQARDSRVADVRSDIWALGVILQELLTGRAVFRAPSRADVLALVLTKNPTPITLLRPEIPVEIERALMRCMQKAPEHRFQTVRELAKHLAPFAAPWAAVNIERLLRPTHSVVEAMRADEPAPFAFAHATEAGSPMLRADDAALHPTLAPQEPTATREPARIASETRAIPSLAIALGLIVVSAVAFGVRGPQPAGAPAPFAPANHEATLDAPRVLTLLPGASPRTIAPIMYRLPVTATEPAQAPDATAEAVAVSPSPRGDEGSRRPASVRTRASKSHATKHAQQHDLRSTGQEQTTRARPAPRRRTSDAVAPRQREREAEPAQRQAVAANRPGPRALAVSEPPDPTRGQTREPTRAPMIDDAEMENPLDGRK